MKVIGIIPARYESTRFPGKPLARLMGKPVIQHVYERSRWAKTVSRLIVATDDRRIREAVEGFGGEAEMTSPGHPTGTDRVAEVARRIPGADIIVNVQGDEALIHPSMIDGAVRALAAGPHLPMATLKKEIEDREELNDPAVVKVVTDLEDYALYFSRSCIPSRERGTERARVYKHIGLYVYRRDFLLDFVNREQTPLEQEERLEQLRAMENGFRIRVVETEHDCVGIDTPEDLERVTRIIKEGGGCG